MSDRSNIYRNIFDGTNQKEWKQEQNNMKDKNLKHMPDQKKHRYVSFIKSGIRIIGYGLIPFSLASATIVLIFSEIIGIVEELV